MFASKQLIPTLLLTALCATPANARAQSGGHHLLELGLSSGAFVPSKQHELYASTETFHAPFAPAGLDLQLHLALFPVSFAGVEVEGGYVPIKTLAGESATLLAARAHAVLQVPGSFSPFLVAGVGALAVRSSAEVLGNDVDRAFHWGGGVKAHVSERVSLRVDLRDVLTASFGANAGNTHHFEAFVGVSVGFFELFPALPSAPMFVAQPPEKVEEEPNPTPKPAVVEPVVAAMRRAPRELDCRIAARNPDCLPAEVVKAEMDRVHFAWGSSALAPEDRSALDNAARLLVEHGDLDVEIDGHTDSTGPQAFNMVLSLRRAEAVKGHLVAKGVAPERVTVNGHGPYEPVDSNTTKLGRAANRRGEIRVEARRSQTASR